MRSLNPTLSGAAKQGNSLDPNIGGRGATGRRAFSAHLPYAGLQECSAGARFRRSDAHLDACCRSIFQACRVNRDCVPIGRRKGGLGVLFESSTGK